MIHSLVYILPQLDNDHQLIELTIQNLQIPTEQLYLISLA